MAFLRKTRYGIIFATLSTGGNMEICNNMILLIIDTYIITKEVRNYESEHYRR